MPWSLVLVVAAGAAIGAVTGWAGRRLLARLRRGVGLRPPILELSAAGVTAVGAGVTWPAPTIVLVGWAGVLLVVLGAVDIAVHRLPDALTLPAIPITAALVLGTWLAAPSAGDPRTALVAAAVVTALFAGMAALAPRAMGRGDVKLVPTPALLTGFVSGPAALWWLVLAFGIGAVIAVAGLVTRRLRPGSAIPFGPCLLAGGWLVVAWPGPFTV